MYTLYGVGAYWCLLLVELSEMCLVQRVFIAVSMSKWRHPNHRRTIMTSYHQLELAAAAQTLARCWLMGPSNDRIPHLAQPTRQLNRSRMIGKSGQCFQLKCVWCKWKHDQSLLFYWVKSVNSSQNIFHRWIIAENQPLHYNILYTVD